MGINRESAADNQSILLVVDDMLLLSQEWIVSDTTGSKTAESEVSFATRDKSDKNNIDSGISHRSYAFRALERTHEKQKAVVAVWLLTNEFRPHTP